MAQDSAKFEGYGAVCNAVAGFSRCRRAWRFLREFSLWLALSLGAVLAWSLGDWLLPLSPFVVLGGLAAAGIVCVAALAGWVVKLVRRAESKYTEAVVIERLHGGLDNRLIGTLQLVEDVARSPEMHSVSLVKALAVQTSDTLRGESLTRLIDRRPALRAATTAGAVLAGALLPVLLVGGFVSARVASVQTSYHLAQELVWPVYLLVNPGDVTLLRGEDTVTLELVVRGGAYSAVRLTAVEGDAEILDAEIPLSGGAAAGRRAEKILSADAMARVEKSFTYRFSVGKHVTRWHTVRVVDRPHIENMAAELQFPPYTQMMPQTLSGMFSSIRALRETAVSLSLASSKPLLRASLTFGGDRENAQPLDISGRFAATQFNVKANVEAELQLWCEDGYEMKTPVRFRIETQEDDPPQIQISGKDEQPLLRDEARSFSFAYTATDDFGVSQVQVFYEVEPVDTALGREKRTGEFNAITFVRPETKVRDVILKPFWDIELKPGDRVRYWMTATDNNTMTGPSTAQSARHSFVVVLPSLGGYTQPEFDWAARRSELLGSLTKVQRKTDFLRLPEKTVAAEKTVPPPKHKLAAHVPSENWPAGVEQAVTDYLRLLSTHSYGESAGD